MKTTLPLSFTLQHHPLQNLSQQLVPQPKAKTMLTHDIPPCLYHLLKVCANRFLSIRSQNLAPSLLGQSEVIQFPAKTLCKIWPAVTLLHDPRNTPQSGIVEKALVLFTSTRIRRLRSR